MASKWEALGPLVFPLGPLGHPFVVPTEHKDRPEVVKTRFGGHRENIDIPIFFIVFQKLAAPNGPPKDGLEALLGRTWGSWGQLLGHVGAILGQSAGLVRLWSAKSDDLVR